MRCSRAAPLVFVLLCLASAAIRAEPYLAVQQGLKCVQCHVNPTGGGLRNLFGNAFAQTQLAASHIDTGDQQWLGEISKYLAVGADLRGNASQTEVPHQASVSQFEVEEARVYLSMSPIPERLAIYIDERVAPGAANNMEAYARYWTANHQWYLKAGQMYLPFGLRLEDDTAFTRQVPGINMTTPDSGVEAGWESGAWSAQLAISNGTAGAEENDDGKQFTSQAVYVASRWRLGAAVSINNADAGDRHAYGLFGGLKTGPISWLAEADLVTDDGFAEGERKLVSGLLEGNWLLRQGHNLKVTAELFDPDRDVHEDQQTRWSALYEFTPVQFMQLRAGVRIYDGIPQNDLQNRKLYFVQLHGFF
jgi:hypothetical protein